MIDKRLEAFADGVWVDLSDDLIGSLSLSWGQRGGGVLDRVATSGSLVFQLRNRAQAELLNGNFEAWIDATTPREWTKVLTGTGAVNRSTTAQAGAFACALSRPTGTAEVYQDILCRPGETYTLSFWLRGTGVPGAGGIFARVRNLRTLNYLTGPVWSASPTDVADVGTSYTLYTWVFTVEQDGGAAVLIRISFHASDAGNGYVDSVVMNPPTEVVGRYSPRNANRLAGWKTGVPIKLTLIDGVTEYVKHRGWLDRISPSAGEDGIRPVFCTSKTWIDQAARHQVRGIGTLVNVTADEVVQELLDTIPIPPFASDLDVGTDTYPFALDDVRGGSYLAAFTQAVFSEFSYGYELADGTVRIESRLARLNSASPVVTIDAMRALDTEEAQSAVGNLVKVTIAPREEDGTVVVLASLKKAVAVPANTTVTIELEYVDPDQRAAHVGGFDMIAPVATTDYLFNAAADGSGTNMTADLAVVAEFGGDSVVLHMTNNNVSTTGYVTKMDPRGTALLTYEPVSFEARDQAAIDVSGEREIEVAMPYQSDPNVARSVADAVLAAWTDPGQSVVVTFLAEHSAAYEEAFLSCDIGSSVAVVEEVTGTGDAYWINGIEVRFQEPGITWVTWFLTKADTGVYWELGVAGRSELGETTVLAPF